MPNAPCTTPRREATPTRAQSGFSAFSIAAAIRVPGGTAREIAATAGAIARLPDRAQPKLITHGDLVRNRYGAGGARMEASNNFPHVIHCGLATLAAQASQPTSGRSLPPRRFTQFDGGTRRYLRALSGRYRGFARCPIGCAGRIGRRRIQHHRRPSTDLPTRS